MNNELIEQQIAEIKKSSRSFKYESHTLFILTYLT